MIFINHWIIRKFYLTNRKDQKLVHLKKLAHDHDLAKTRIYLKFPIKDEDSLEKTYKKTSKISI